MTGGKSRNACRRQAALKLIAPKGRYHHPLNLLNLLNPLNPHARKGVSKAATTTLGPKTGQTSEPFAPKGRAPSSFTNTAYVIK